MSGRRLLPVGDRGDTCSMATMTGPKAREFWKALMDNASCLVADARLLLEADSFGRARSLTILAQEELGKALWIYDEFEAVWSCGHQDARTVERLREHGRHHIQKYLEASTLATSWRPSGATSMRTNPDPARRLWRR